MMWYLIWFLIGCAFGGLFMLAASLLAMASIEDEYQHQETLRLDRLS